MTVNIHCSHGVRLIAHLIFGKILLSVRELEQRLSNERVRIKELVFIPKTTFIKM